MAEEKLTIAILCGGKSGEHEVSLISANNIQAALDRETYNVVIIGIDKSGEWHLSLDENFLDNTHDIREVQLNMSKPVVYPMSQGKIVDMEARQTLASIDVFFPITHGVLGEDGALQGLLRLLDVPYVGPDVWGSAIGMDKDVAKRLLRDEGLPVAPFITLRSPETISFQDASDILGSPIFIKPCRQGSSLGVTKASDPESFEKGLQTAFLHDRKILLEKAIQGKEVECAVLGNESPKASKVLGEIIPKHEFYSYEAKYVDEKGADLEIPAQVSSEIVEKVRDAAVKTFKTLECEGLARVDFFVEPDGSLIVNEINTLPGFTNISMYPKLWEASGLPYSKLLDRLIALAIDRHQKEKDLKQ